MTGASQRTSKPLFVEVRSSTWMITFVVAFAVFSDILLYGLMVPFTPTALHERVGLKEEDEQRWTAILLALFSVGMLVFSPISGYVTDHTSSRQWPFMAGLLALAAGTAMLCAGTSLGLWIVGRILQGASTGTVWSAGIALIVDSVDQKQVGQYLGYTGTALSLGTLMGPVLGGVIYEHGGYYSVFAFSFALIALDFALRLVVIEKRHARPWTQADMSHPPSRSSAREASPAGDHKNSDRASRIHSLRRASDASDPTAGKNNRPAALLLLSSRRMLSALYGCIAISLMIGSFETVLPLFVRDTFGWKQTGQGLIFFAINIPQLLSPLTGAMMDKYPQSCRYFLSAMFVATIPIFVCLRFVTHDTLQQKVLLCALLALFGLCVSLLLPGLLIEVGAVADQKERKKGIESDFGKGGATAQAFGLSNMAYGIGSLVGPFLAGFLRDAHGWGTMSWVLGLVSGVTSIPTLLFMGGWIGKQTGSEP